MNILFLLKSFSYGGVEVVTSVLANKFAGEGHHVVIWAFNEENPKLDIELHKDVKVVYGCGFKVSSDNVTSFVNTLKINNIEVVINQWALPFQPTSLLKKAIKEYSVRIISVHHSDPITNGRLKSVESEMRNTANPLVKTLLIVKKQLFKTVTSYSFRRSYRISDKFVVLSDSYKKHFLDSARVKDNGKLVTIVNPVTLDLSGIGVNLNEKDKSLLYIGRLECQNKKPDRVLRIWSKIMDNDSDWHLDIVGDGPDIEKLTMIAARNKLDRYRFWGYQTPLPFYRKASVLLLTSDFEGFPLVLTEAMSFGVVPVVYGSFTAVRDIIDDGVNGFIVPPKDGHFDCDAMAQKVADLVSSPKRLRQMSLSALEKSKVFSLDSIYNQWTSIL